MKNLLPSGLELSILGVLAIICAAVAVMASVETALVGGGFVLLLTSMLMGARRAGRFAPPVSSNPPAEPVEATVD